MHGENAAQTACQTSAVLLMYFEYQSFSQIDNVRANKDLTEHRTEEDIFVIALKVKADIAIQHCL
jgi:hypothetical protein